MVQIICPVGIISGAQLSKDKRHDLFGKVSGGSDSMKLENFQRLKIVEGTGIECPKTKIRINLRTFGLKELSQPNKKNDGFDYSEDFDGLQQIRENKIYINFKCVVGKGGSQTRSLREVYWFILGQLNSLKISKNIYFANILDGDEADASMDKYQYLLDLPEFKDVKKLIYVGDLKNYFSWFNKTFVQSDAQ